jgi:DNA polymerase
MNQIDRAIWQAMGLGPQWRLRESAQAARDSLTDGILLAGEFDVRTDVDGTVVLAGQTGELLLNMLAAVGWDVQALAFAPMAAALGDTGSASPAMDFSALVLQQACRQVVVIGDAAVAALFGVGCSVAQLRGQVHALRMGQQVLDALVLDSPAFLLAQPAGKRQAWQDLCFIRDRFALPH